MRKIKHVTTAIALTLCASSASATTLGLATTGPVETAVGELSYGFELAGFDIADIEATGTNGQTIEFQLSAFDSYTNGALLLVDVSASASLRMTLLSAFRRSQQQPCSRSRCQVVRCFWAQRLLDWVSGPRVARFKAFKAG